MGKAVCRERCLIMSLDDGSRDFLADMIKDDPSLNVAALAKRIGVGYRPLCSALSPEGNCSRGDHRKIMAFVVRERRLRMWSETLNEFIDRNPKAGSAFRNFLSRIGRERRDSGEG